jgi:thiamine biosynthesis protein ThiI
MDGAAEGMPVYRPLAGMDAAQVEALAKRVGTYEASARAEASCPAAPRGLEAEASLAEVVEAEEALRLREAALEEAERLEERVVEA